MGTDEPLDEKQSTDTSASVLDAAMTFLTENGTVVLPAAPTPSTRS